MLRPVVLCAAVLVPLIAGAAALRPEEAKRHVGARATICGVVASADYAARSRSQTTLLDLGQPYPRQVFTAVILHNDRAKFGTPETMLDGKEVCVTGKITIYRGKPAVILHDAKQLSIVAKPVVDGVMHRDRAPGG